LKIQKFDFDASVEPSVRTAQNYLDVSTEKKSENVGSSSTDGEVSARGTELASAAPNETHSN